MQPLLTILIPTLKSRFDKLKEQVQRIEYQRQTYPVQILWLGDNKSISVGEKRNNLLGLAKGQWVCFVDDDDEILDGYVNNILRTIEGSSHKKVITFFGKQTDNGIPTQSFRYGKQYGRNHKQLIDGETWKVMLPDHLCIWKTETARLEEFPKKQLGEDHAWAQKMVRHYDESDQVEIPDYLYHYHFNRNLTECRD